MIRPDPFHSGRMRGYLFALALFLASCGGGENNPPVSVAVDPPAVTLTPSIARFAYAANSESNNVSMFTIDSATGALTSIGVIAAGNQPRSVKTTGAQ